MWWEPIVRANRARPDGLRVYESPLAFERGGNTFPLLQILQHLGVEPAAGATIVDVGLPAESITFAAAGYRVQAFEARQDGYHNILRRIKKDLGRDEAAQKRIQLHHIALSNYTGTTEIFYAKDSSSLLKGAVLNGPKEKAKFLGSGRRVETVPVTTLDNYFRSLPASSGGDAAAAAAAAPPVLAASIVGMKIDTQGVEPEIFMGAQGLLADPNTRPRAIVTEYCTYLRPFDELSVGLHLLIGLGYTCYYHQGNKFNLGESTVITPETVFEGDLHCTHRPLTVEKAVDANNRGL
jgi:hypothetical protein